METPMVSKLPKNEERFLSKYLAMLMALGYITVEKLYEIFPPLALFTRYANEPERRCGIFNLTKLGSDYALEFDLDASAVILTKGVKLGDVKLEDLYRVVSPDELVRVHDRRVLYALIKDAKPFAMKDDKSCQLMAHAIGDVITERLGSDNPSDIEADREAGQGSKVYQFVVDAIGEQTFVSDAVPEEARGRIIKAGLNAYKKNYKFTPDFLFEAVPLSELVGYLSFDKFEPVIDAVALKFGWVELPAKAFEVPKPGSDQLPPEALDSIIPPPNAPASGPDDPEVEFTGGSETEEIASAEDASAEEGDDGPEVEISNAETFGGRSRRNRGPKPPPLPGK